MPASVPNTFTFGGLSSASAVNANFTSLKNYVNTSLQTTDAAGTYTATPELVSYIEPTNLVQLVPKKYVDKRGSTFVKATSGLSGTASGSTAIQSSLLHQVPAGLSTHLLEWSGSVSPVSASPGQGFALFYFNQTGTTPIQQYFHVFDIAADQFTPFHGSILVSLNLPIPMNYTITCYVGLYSYSGPISYNLGNGSIVWRGSKDDLTVL